MASGVGDGWLPIGEVARTLGMSRTTLLAAEEAGLLHPIRTPGGHRRYDPADVRRFLGQTDVPDAQPAPPPGPVPPFVHRTQLATTVRAAVRELVQVLDAVSGGVYLHEAGRLRFCAAFGVPRWLGDRLRDGAPPAPLVHAMSTDGPRVFDPATAGFPEPRQAGQGLAVALKADEQTLGVLFLVTRPERELLPGELRVVGACRRLIAMVVKRELQVGDLERRLGQIEVLTRTG